MKALQDELENPLNVHRWRKLEATDQETFERILKIQTLQRRLIAKTEEVNIELWRLLHYMKVNRCMYPCGLGPGKREANQREGEIVHGVKEHSRKTAWPRDSAITNHVQRKSEREVCLDEEDAW